MSYNSIIDDLINTPVEGLEETDFIYIEHPEIRLKARLYKNKTKKMHPIVIDIHGGAWNFGDRYAGVYYDRHLALAGFRVVAIDFRKGPDHRHPSASEDIEAAIEYVYNHAGVLKGDPEHIGLIGSSSGGHLALYSGILSRHRLDYVVALWPVSDPAYRYEYAKRVNRNELLDAHENYFNNFKTMQSASVQRIVKEGKWNQLPPILVVQPGEDKNVPLEMTFELLNQYQLAGGYLEYAFFPGMEHGFAHCPSLSADRCNSLIVDFIRRHS